MIFKILSILFILNSLYYILNYKRIDEPFKMRDKNNKLDLFHYMLKVGYIIWLVIGIFNFYSIFILILSSLILFRIPIYLVSKRFSLVYHRLVPPLTILVLLFYLFS